MRAPASLLALHTSEPEGSIAIAHAGRLTSARFEAAGQHAPVLLAELLSLASKAGVTLADLEGVVATTGPGSFTGIRVGLATAAGLAAARHWSIWACDALRARAAACDAGDVPALAVVLDARRGEVYAGLYAPGTVPEVIVEPFCAPPAIAARRLLVGIEAAGDGARNGGADLGLTGSGIALVAGALGGRAWKAFECAQPVAAALAGLAQAGACRPVPAQALEPMYLRKSDAEVRRESFFGSES